MKAKAIKIQSLTWPVLFLIAGIITSHFGIFTHGKFISGFVLIGLCGSWLLCKYSRTERQYALQYMVCLGLFFTMGWGVTSLHETQFQKYTTQVTQNTMATGKIVRITHFSKMDRIQVRLPVTYRWGPSHYFNINLLDKNHNLHKGQIIALSSKLTPILSSPNPYTFQAQEYWKLQSTSHEIFLYDTTNIHIIQNHIVSPIDNIRHKAEKRIDELYSNDSQAGILKALLLGKKEGVSKTDIEDFKSAGLMHILAVSGLHVGIISSILFVILLPIKFIFPNSWIHYIAVISALWIYAALTGMNIPVIRAVILISFYLTAFRINRQINKWNIFFWAVLLVLCIHPNALFTVSFQLSFGAVAAILLFYSEFQELLKPLLGQNYFSGLIAVSLAAQIGIFPLLLFHFQEISLVSTISSFLVIPLLFPLILISSFSIIVPASWIWLSGVLTIISTTIIDLITEISGMLASWRFSSQIWVMDTATIVFLLVALLLAGLYLEFKQNLRSWLVHASLVCVFFAGLNEGLNIYFNRNQALLAVYENRKNPITDLYYKGVCYTNSTDVPVPYLIRNRKRYYSNNTVILKDKKEWNDLIAWISTINAETKPHGRTYIKVVDYIKNENYPAGFPIQKTGEVTNSDPDLLPTHYLYRQN